MLDQPRLHFPLVVLLCLVLYFPFLGARDFWEHENEYAEATRIMFVEGNYALPESNGEVWPDRPILFFWLALFFSTLAGGVGEWSVRLPNAVSATALIAVFYLFVKKRFDLRSAFLAALVLATCLLTVHVERHVPVNMAYFLFVVLAMMALMEVLVYDSDRPIHVYGSWLCLALACLTKGPIGVLVPVIVVCLYCFFSGRWKRALALRPFAGALLFLAVAAPWFVYVTWKTSGSWAGDFFAAQYLWRHNADSGNHAGSLLLHALDYYAFHVLAGFIPWSFFFVPAGISLWPDRSKLRDGPVLFLGLWCATALLFSPFSDSQHGHDLFLSFPPVALAMAVYLDRLLSATAGDAARRWTHRFLVLGFAFLVFAGLSAPFIVTRFFEWPVDPTSQLAIIGFALAAVAMGFLYALKKRSYRVMVGSVAALIIVANLLLHLLVFPSFNRLKPRRFAEAMRGVVQPGGSVAIFRSSTSYKFNFYSGIKRIEKIVVKPEVQGFLGGPGPRFLLVKDRDMPILKELWQGSLDPVLVSNGSERWMLLYSCRAACEPLAASAR